MILVSIISISILNLVISTLLFLSLHKINRKSEETYLTLIEYLDDILNITMESAGMVPAKHLEETQ